MFQFPMKELQRTQIQQIQPKTKIVEVRFGLIFSFIVFLLSLVVFTRQDQLLKVSRFILTVKTWF
jgi:hypothetical protein